MITIGRISRTIGRHGSVQVEPLTDYPERFLDLKKIVLSDDTDNRIDVEIESVDTSGGKIVLRFKGYDTPEKMRSLKGWYLLVGIEQSYPLPEGRYYVFDIVGLEVVTKDGQMVGRIKDVMTLTGNDVYVVETENGERLIPATREIIREIDMLRGVMTIHPLPGLFEL